VNGKHSYAVIGAGAVGGLYGARLQRSGHDVRFLLRSDYEHVGRHGLSVDSPAGDFVLPRVHAYRNPEDVPPCDIVIMALKSTANDSLPDLLPPVARNAKAILAMQNGLGVEDRIAGLVAGPAIFGALCFLCSNKVGPGRIRHLDYGQVTLALRTPDASPGGIPRIMREIAADFEAAGTPVTLVEDLVLARWQKLMWNIPFSGLSVVLRANTLEMIRHEHTRALARDLMFEVAEGAAGFGRRIGPDFVEEMLGRTARMTPYETSMKLDFEHGRPMEVEAIYGEPVRAAESRGIRLRRIETLYRQLTFLDGKTRQTRPPEEQVLAQRG
jgi:2-dehydropantoate 2-reductase